MRKPLSAVTSLTIAALIFSCTNAIAQDGHRENEHREREHGNDGPKMEPAFFQQLYPAELVLRHADAIGLRADQKAAIQSALPKIGKGADRERQSAEARKLEQLLKNDRVDETLAMAQLDTLLDVEDSFKRRQLQALIKIKNILTPEQRGKLDELRRQHSGQPKDGEPRSGLPKGDSHKIGESGQ